MSNRFIRVLWGDSSSDHPPRVYNDIQICQSNHLHLDNTITYCYGTDNQAFLRSIGIEPIMVSPEPVWHFGPDSHRHTSGVHGEMNFGLRMFAMKLRALRDALESHDQVVLLDWDTQLSVPTLPANFWDTMQKGRSFQASLYQHRHPSYWWRQYPMSAQALHGCFIYCRSLLIAEQLLSLQYLQPEWYEEKIMGVWAEMQFGGWDSKASNRWKAEGYEPYCVQFRKQIHNPNITLFSHR